MNLEAALAEQEERVERLVKQTGRYLAALKAWKKACGAGDLGRLAAAAETAAQLAPELGPATSEAAAAWDFPVREYLTSGDWRDELQAAAERQGLRPIAEGETLICSPVVVTAVPARSALKLGRDVFRTVRPAVVAAELKRLRERTTSANAAAFLESLFGAWEHLTSAQQPVATFRAIYDLFYLTPGWRRDNPRTAFAQAVYALHQSGTRATRGGRSFELTFPSGNVRENDVFAVVAEDGQMLRYYGIRFR